MNNDKSTNLGILNKIRTSKLRQIIWPIKSSELIKFIPMALLMFVILLSYNIVRSIKDSLVMTKIAPEVISFIKLWIEMPAGILMVLLYSALCNKMSTEKVFKIIVGSFVAFFGIFAYLIYPNKALFHPNPEMVDFYVSQYPHLKWFIKIWGQWTFVLFYVMGELWPLVVFSLLFWHLANKITKTEEAKRFYSFFSLFGQSNLLISGSIIVYFSSSNHIFSNYFAHIQDNTEIMIKSLMLLVLISSILIFILHSFIEHKIISDPRYFKPQNKIDKLELSLSESIKLVLKSRYLWLTCILLISYSMSVNLIEGLWLSKVKEYYQTTEKFIRYQGTVLLWTGVFTMICALVGSSVIRYFGWFWGAITTPAMIMIVGVIFFTFCLLEDHLEHIFYSISLASAQLIIVVIGGIQNVLGKGTKYSLFDASKEMLYIPLDNELKTKGKAAVDIVGAKIGKSSGAIMQFSIFTIFPNAKYDNIIPFLMVVFILVCLFWMYGIKILNKEYTEKMKNSEHIF
jgi:ADP/ATP carrier protein family